MRKETIMVTVTIIRKCSHTECAKRADGTLKLKSNLGANWMRAGQWCAEHAAFKLGVEANINRMTGRNDRWAFFPGDFK